MCAGVVYAGARCHMETAIFTSASFIDRKMNFQEAAAKESCKDVFSSFRNTSGVSSTNSNEPEVYTLGDLKKMTPDGVRRLYKRLRSECCVILCFLLDFNTKAHG